MGAHGHIKFFDPFPYGFSLGKTEEEITKQSLAMLREQVCCVCVCVCVCVLCVCVCVLCVCEGGRVTGRE